MNSFPYDYEEEHADKFYADIYNDELLYGEFVKAGRMAELINQPEGNTKMATEFDTTAMTLDEIQAAVATGELDLNDVKFTDEQAAEAEAEATITIAELHGALDVLFGDMEAKTDGLGTPVELMLASILGLIVEGRQIQAIFDMLGLDEESALDLTKSLLKCEV